MLLPPKSVFPAASGRVAVLALSRTRGEVPFGKKEPRAIPVPTGLPESFPVKKLPVSIIRTELWFGPCPLIARLALHQPRGRGIRLVWNCAGTIEAREGDRRRCSEIKRRHDGIRQVAPRLVTNEGDVRPQRRVRLDSECQYPRTACRRVEARVYRNAAIDKGALVEKVDLDAVGVEEGAVGGHEARAADRPEGRVGCLLRREVTGSAIDRHREPDRRTPKIGGVNPVGPDLPAGIGNVEARTVAGKTLRVSWLPL